MPLDLQPKMSELIKLAKAAKLAKQAKLLEEKMEMEAKALNEKIGDGKLATNLEVLDFDTFVQNLFQNGHGGYSYQSQGPQVWEASTLA